MSKMQESRALGLEFWNDSCDLDHLQEAIDAGAVGATCNPVIVFQATSRKKEVWSQVLRSYLETNPQATEDEASWFLIKDMGKKAAQLLRPIFDKSEGRQGRLSLQVEPCLFPSAERMLKQAFELADLAPNITIKIPSTDAGITVMEELNAHGISVNATVSFSVSQALASAEAIERGCQRAKVEGKLQKHHCSYVTIMVGRIEDYLRQCIQDEKLSIDPVAPLWSGIAVFKEAHKLFSQKQYSARLLSAAYRHQMHWTELLGPGIVQSIPYEFWKRFDRSTHVPSLRLAEPVPEQWIRELEKIPAYKLVSQANAIGREDFVNMLPSRNTLNQFLNGQDDLRRWIRSLMLV